MSCNIWLTFLAALLLSTTNSCCIKGWHDCLICCHINCLYDRGQKDNNSDFTVLSNPPHKNNCQEGCGLWCINMHKKKYFIKTIFIVKFIFNSFNSQFYLYVCSTKNTIACCPALFVFLLLLYIFAKLYLLLKPLNGHRFHKFLTRRIK